MRSSDRVDHYDASTGLALPLCGAAEQDVLEELTRSPPGAPVHVSGDPSFEKETRVLENRGIEVVRIVHDDKHPRVPRKLRCRVVEHLAHRVDISAQRRPAPPSRPRANLLIASVDQAEQLVGVAMLLVVVDQAGVRRGRDDSRRRTW